MTHLRPLLALLTIAVVATSCQLVPEPVGLPRPYEEPISASIESPPETDGFQVGVGVARMAEDRQTRSGSICPNGVVIWPIPPLVKLTDFGVSLGVESPEGPDVWGGFWATDAAPLPESTRVEEPTREELLIREDR